MRNILPAIALVAMIASAQAQYQVNQTEASLTLNGASSNGATASEVGVDVGGTAALVFSSTSVGLPFDIFFNGASQVAAPPGLLLGTQLVNVDVLGAGVFFLSGNGAGFTIPGLPLGGIGFSQILTIPCNAPGTLSLQSYAVAPAVPGAVALSSATTLNCFACITGNPNASTVALTDDSFSQQTLVAPFVFYGSVYSDCFIGSNGFVTFGTGDTDLSESLAEMNSDQPRIALLWDDLNPSAGGNVTFFADGNGFQVRFNGVPEFAQTTPNTFQLDADTSSGLLTVNYCRVSALDALVGLSPGGNLSLAPLTTVDWSVPGQTLSPVDSAFELFTAVTPFDLGNSQIVWVLDTTGGPVTNL